MKSQVTIATISRLLVERAAQFVPHVMEACRRDMVREKELAAFR